MARRQFGARGWYAVPVLLLAMGLAPVAGAADATLAQAQKAIKAGKTDAALKSLNAALSGNSLKGGDVARAFYLRGLANSKAGNAAAAIADLSQALWLKGLSDSERQDATVARTAAYKQAGLSAPASDAVAAAKASEPVQQPEPVPASKAIPTPPTQAPAATDAVADEAANAPADSPAWTVKTAQSAAAKRKKKSQPVTEASASDTSGPASLPWQTQSAASTGSSGPVMAVADNSQQTAAPTQQSGDPLTSLLGSLFGSAQPASAAPTADSQAATASTQTSQVGQADVAPKLAAPSKPKGGVYLQVASLRTPDEAQSLADRLTREQADILQGVDASVHPTVMGNMGTFYTVRLGPVASKPAGESLCGKLRSKGVDCFFAAP